ncbi:MAG: nickel-dependent lactate racemase [Atopobiaceae bacterium]|nr:nickel-dependent lactate racemase [Atopobiaceae bacterium]
MRIRLPYGTGNLEIEIPDERIAGILVPEGDENAYGRTEEEIVRDALDEPIGSAPLEELVRGKERIVLIASDHTRPVPTRILFPQMLERIRKGNPDALLTVLIATGCHRDTTEAELRAKFGDEFIGRDDIRFVVHDSRDDSALVEMGELPSGGRYSVNRIARDADLLIAEGFIEPHFFAGFSGGRKSVLPGICNAKTVMANHCAEFIDSPFARTGVLEGNPIHRDMVYAAEKLGLAFILNVALDTHKRIIGAWAGEMHAAHEAGCAFVERSAGVDAVPADIVISTNGGYPLDQNIYQSVKGMTAAEASAAPGAAIIMVSKCDDGHGGQAFFDTFASGEPLEDILARFRATPAGETIADQWQSQIFIRVLEKHPIIFVSDAPDDMVRALRMEPAHSLEEALGKAEAAVGRHDAKVSVIPDGVSVIVRS